MRKKSTRKNTVREFMESCLGLLKKATREGATMADLYEIAMDAGCPKCTRSTFQTQFYKTRAGLRVLMETAK